jgi:hypothetical protein
MSEIHFHLLKFHFQFSLCVKVHACMNVKTDIETLSMVFEGNFRHFGTFKEKKAGKSFCM